MKCAFISILTYLLPLNVGECQRRDCTIKFPIKEDRNQPLILQKQQKKYNLVIPENGDIKLKSGESIALFCPYAKNVLKQSKSNFTTVNCVNANLLRANGLLYSYNQLECNSLIRGSINYTSTRCANKKGIIINIGFKVPNNNWITLIQVCYDNKTANTFYSQHILYGEAIKYASTQKYRPAFHETGVMKSLSANTAYTQTNQKKIFRNLLGSEYLVNKYLNKQSFLVRGHLAPDADFLFSGLQFSTYFFINTCPQWDVINGNNWVSIENMVRRVAQKYGQPFRVITGTHGILSLPDKNNNLQDIFLNSKKLLPVPKYLWKVIYLESAKEGIALININNPFLQNLDNNDILCPNICSDFGWNSNKWTNMAKGFIFCCDIRTLRKTINTIPALHVKGVLKAK